ncbi:MAG: hypothetical protein DRK00_09925 [Thermoprotei archaeon]|nr:MAG: hypothetical protein DRK00_09925 [Thermoprotei archaeon]
MPGLGVYKYAVKFAWNDISSRRVRAALTIMGIAVGVASLVALMSITLGMKVKVENILAETLGLAVTLSSKTALVPTSLVTVVREIPGVVDAYPVIEHAVITEKALQPAILEGVPPEKLLDLFPSLEVKEGRVFRRDGEGVLITSKLAERLNVGVGDAIEVSPRSTGAASRKYRVLGIVEVGLSFGEMGFVIMPLRDAQELCDRPGYASAIVIRVASKELISPVAEALRKMFPEARVIEPKQVAMQISKVMNVINATLLSIASISLVVAALSVMNTITMVVRERMREIGILKALGAQRHHVLAIFLSEALLLSLMGGLVGVALGVTGAQAVSSGLVRFMGMELRPVVDPLILTEGLGVAVLVGVAAGFQPAWKGANSRPREALRYK